MEGKALPHTQGSEAAKEVTALIALQLWLTVPELVSGGEAPHNYPVLV